MYEWVKWTWEKDEKKLVWAAGTNINIEWITNKFLKSHIESTAFQENSSDYRRKLPTKERGGHLYWAVFEEEKNSETDLKTGLNLGKTQVYVGRAGNGVINRWMEDSKSHCAMMRESRDVARNIINYDPNVLKGKQLVDLRLLLHKVSHPDGRNSGIFIMGVEEELKNQIILELEEKLKDLDGKKLQLEAKLKDMEEEKLKLEENLKDKKKGKQKSRQEKLEKEEDELKTSKQKIEQKI